MRKNSWLALSAVLLAVLAVGMDVTILSVALPTLATALHASETTLQWFSSAYTLALVAAMLPAGFLGDRYGRKLVMVVALLLFGGGSALCAFAPSPAVFTAARVVLGVAGAAVAIMALSSLLVLFDERERPKAVGAWAAFNFIALPVGPILGGWLLSHAWWGWVFLINVPVALVGLVAVMFLVPESRSSNPPALDVPGIALSVAGLVAFTYGLISAGQSGSSSASAIFELAAGIVLLFLFARWESRLARTPARTPLVDRGLLTSRTFLWGVLLLLVLTMPMIGVLFTMPQYFQAILAVNAEGSGLRLLALVAGLIVGAGVSGRLERRGGMRVTVATGFLLLAAGLALGATMAPGTGYTVIGLWMALAGAGMGVALTSIVSGALGEVSSERGGMASGILQTLKNLGAPFGAAVFGSVLASRYDAVVAVAHLPAATLGMARQSVFAGMAVARTLHQAGFLQTVQSAFVQGTDASLVVSAAIAVVGAIAAVAFLPGVAAGALTRTP